MSEPWLALIIGNTRLHWGFFEQDTLKGVWHTPHVTARIAEQLKTNGFSAATWQAIFGIGNSGGGDDDSAFLMSDQAMLPEQAMPLSSLWVASVVPEQAALWDVANVVVRSHIPLLGLYPTIGIDRAINVLGAGSTLGWPVLVIDGGTALTFTAGVQRAEGNAIAGGAILPGVRLQRHALAQQTAALGDALPKSMLPKSMLPKSMLPKSMLPKSAFNQSMSEQWAMSERWAMPERWATDTEGAIASGILYGTAAIIADYITDWWQRFPAGHVVLTGGDGPLLHALLQQRTPAIAARVQVDSDLMFWGMRAYRKA
jgi:type III pantothenate kinase